MTETFPTRSMVAVLLYIALVFGLGFASVAFFNHIADRFAKRASIMEVIKGIEARSRHPAEATKGIQDGWPSGSPFLDGQTVTLASASLLQTLARVITNAGGTLHSSEVDAQSIQSKDRFVKAIANCEIAESALQELLFDIETGMPFLFIDQLSVKTETHQRAQRRVRILIRVSGMWTGAK